MKKLVVALILVRFFSKSAELAGWRKFLLTQELTCEVIDIKSEK